MELNYNFYTKKNQFSDPSQKKTYKELLPENNDILIINYESLSKRRKSDSEDKKDKKVELKENIIDFLSVCKDQRVAVIIDESHKVKNLKTIQTKSIKKILDVLELRSECTYLYLLTGTPFTQGFIDLYSQLKLLGWDKNKTYFEDNFCIKGDIRSLKEWEQPIVGYKNVDQIYDLVHQFGITIKTKDVIQLPEQVFNYHKLKSSMDMILYTCETLKRPTIQAELDRRKCDYELPIPERGGRINNPFYRNIAFPDLDWLAETAGSFWLRARQLSIGFQGNSKEAMWFNDNRLRELKTLLEDHPDNYVLFYNYTPELLQIYDICEMLGYKIDIYSGEIKSEIFYNKYASQTPEERLINTKNIIIANYASGGTGSNWQLYNKCILFSVPIFKDWEQSIKRVHRIGQKETVIYHIFYEDNWLDNSMLESLQQGIDYNTDLFMSDLQRVQKLFRDKQY